MKRSPVIITTALSLAVSGLVGCDAAIRKATDLGIEEGAQLTSAQRELLRAQLDGRVYHENKPFYGAAVQVKRGEVSGQPLPRAVEGARGLAIKISGQSDVRTIANAITAATDIPIKIRTRYVLEDSVVEVPIGTKMAVNYEGALSALLDRMSARMDIAWEYDGTGIIIDRMKRATWRVALPFGTTSFEDTFSDESGAEVASSRTLDGWADLEARLTSLAPPPAQVTLAPEMGRVDVFGPPSVHKAVRAVLDDVVATANTRIGLDVAIYFIDSDKADTFGSGLIFNATAGTRNNLPNRIGGRFGFSPTAGVVTDGVQIISGNDAVSFEALARDSAVVDYRLASSVAQSGVVTPITMTTERAFIRSVEIERGDSDVDEGRITYEIADLTTGLSLVTLPRLIEERRIQLALKVTQRAFQGFDPDVSARTGNLIQAPTVENREIRNQTVLSPGETLVISGYDQTAASRADSGTNILRRIGLGGQTEAEYRKVRIVVMVRPTLIADREDRA
ncbi:MAG: secretion protein [Aestuariivita sp.]|nr:secretion protein [Aestuariivita sp.]MCY4345414.1 secretion protein [Aestuariivita sp.]